MVSIMEGLVNDLDTEKFINAVKEHPAIWDLSHEDHSDRGVKKLAWDAVITTFVTDFDERTSSEKKNLCNAFSRKWKSLRDCYSRELAKKRKEWLSGVQVTFRKEYVYYEHLKFLGTTVKSSNAAEEDGEASKDPYDLESSANDTEYIEEPPSKRSRPRKSNSYEEEHIPISTQKQNGDDPDRQFMLSLVPELNKIPDHMKLEIKSNLIAVFIHAQKKLRETKLSRSNGHLGSQVIPVSIPPVHLNIPISINFEPTVCTTATRPEIRVGSIQSPQVAFIQPEVLSSLHDLDTSLCKSEPVSDVSDDEFQMS